MRDHNAWMAEPSLNLAYHPTHVVLGSGLHTIDWIEISNQKNSETCMVLWHTTEFCRCNKSFVFANSETETCLEICTIHFPTTPSCSTTVDVLETGDVPILFSPAFGLFSSPAECSTMEHIVLDLTSLTYQPTTKSGWIRSK